MGFVAAKVKSLIHTYDTNCPFELAKSLGIEVLYEDLGNTLGYYNKFFRIKIIHINQGADEASKKFICAHELGHAILHPDANTPFLKKHTLYSTDRIEHEANRFAVELLLPGEIIQEYKNTNMTIYEAANLYGVPTELAHLKRHKIF